MIILKSGEIRIRIGIRCINKKNEILAKTQTSQKEKHSSQALVSSIILLSRSLASSGPFPRNERQPALSQGFRGFM
jgi:hypothetical protein